VAHNKWGEMKTLEIKKPITQQERTFTIAHKRSEVFDSRFWEKEHGMEGKP
jgi:hypothetical protein